MLELIEKFKNREVKAKEIFEIKQVSQKEARDIVSKYHYLGDKKFMFSMAYGLFIKGHDDLVGCAVFGMVGGVVALKGWFGLDNSHSNEFLELNRLVMNPILNGCNATSFLLSNALKDIKKNHKEVRAIISLADASCHHGYVYQACNFQYHGISSKAKDLYTEDGRLNPRGKTKDLRGVWLNRTQKHRYIYVFDKSLNIIYKQEKYPKGNGHLIPDCCNGTNRVFDARFRQWYTCPKCTGKLEKISPKTH